MTVTRRRLLRTGIAAGTVLGFPAILPTSAQTAPLRIGAVLPFSGGLELFGLQARLGIELAVAEINEAGGILGRPLEVIFEDNRTDPRTSVERTTRLIQRDEVVAVTGPIASHARDAMQPTHERLRTPLLYATNYEGGACGRYVFSFNTVPNQELARLLPHMRQIAGDSFYMFGADYIWPQRMFETARGIIGELGGRVLGEEYTPLGAVREYAPVIRRIADSGAEVLVFALPGADGITFINQAIDFGLLERLEVAFLGFSEAYLGAFGEGRGEDMWVTVPLVSSSDAPGVVDFVGRIRAMAGPDAVVSHYVMTHYNAVRAVAAAAEKVGSVEREALVDGLAGLTLDTPTGELTIDADHHHVTLEMFLARTARGDLELVEPLGRLAPEPGC
jgi:urea transport system substrate-binding protein